MILFAGDIIRQECAKHGISRELLISPRRSVKLTAIRRDIIARMESEYDLGPSAIGRLLHRDHTTIGHHLAWLKSQNSSPESDPPRTDQEKTASTVSRHPDNSPVDAPFYTPLKLRMSSTGQTALTGGNP